MDQSLKEIYDFGDAQPAPQESNTPPPVQLEKSIMEDAPKPAETPLLHLGRNAISHEALGALELPEPEWLVPMMVPWPGMVAISGRPGSYKTFYAMAMALAITQSQELYRVRHDKNPYADLNEKQTFIGKPTGVLFIEDEMVPRQMHARSKMFPPAPGANLEYLIGGSVKMSDRRHRKEILDHMEIRNQKCLILDPFSSVAGFQDENDNAEVAPFMDTLRRDFVARGITIIIVHHPSKGDDSGVTLRGAGDITGKVDEHIVLEKDDDQRDEVIIRFAKTRDVDPLKVHDHRTRFGFDPNGFRTFEYIERVGHKSDKEASALERAAEEASERFPHLSGDELVKKAKEIKRDQAVSDAVKRAVAKRPPVPYVPPIDRME